MVASQLPDAVCEGTLIPVFSLGPWSATGLLFDYFLHVWSGNKTHPRGNVTLSFSRDAVQ
jgi:hypothetical protein